MKEDVIKYPCRWSYLIIGRDAQEMKNAVADCMQQNEYLLTTSNTSRSGKYISLNLETIVTDETDRNKIYMNLKRLSCVTLVL